MWLSVYLCQSAHLCLKFESIEGMKDTELKGIRDRDLFLAYQKALKEHSFQNQWEAIEYVRKSPAPRFYISSKVCSLLLGKLFAGQRLEQMHPLSYRRIKHLEKMYKNYVSGEVGKKGLSRERVCEILVDMPAPEFYISNLWATRIINKEITRHNNERLRRNAI